MTRLSVSIAAVLAAFAAGAQDIPFVPGQGSAATLTDADRRVAVAAIDALAADLKIPKEKILVDTIRAVDWSNSSIGCPKPGVAYLEVITPGHKVTLRADGQVYVVHEAKEQAIVCHDTKALAGIDPTARVRLRQAARRGPQDLAERLDVPENDIKSSPPKAQPGTTRPSVVPNPEYSMRSSKVFGWKMTLCHDGRDVTYHTDLEPNLSLPADLAN